MTDEEMAANGIEVSAYRFKADGDVRVEWRGGDNWAVIKTGCCLNSGGEWEYEPMPSWRDDEFIARCRFGREDALRLALLKIQQEAALARAHAGGIHSSSEDQSKKI